jgi:hypothetical protein
MRAWTLPLIVVGLVLPGTLGMLIAGPGVGLAAGELCAVVVVVAAALQRPDEPIEVASSADGRSHVLVATPRAIDEPELVEEVVDACGDPEVDLLVLVPARAGTLSHWTSDLGPGRQRAQVALVHSVAALAAAGVDARGKVGDADLLQAIEDALRSFPADRVVLVGDDRPRARGRSRTAAQLRRRLEVPLTQLEGEFAPRSAAGRRAT